MTASTMALSGTSTSINFKLSATATYGTGARQDVAGTQCCGVAIPRWTIPSSIPAPT